MILVKMDMKNLFTELSTILILKLIIHPILIMSIFFIFPIENKIWVQTAILVSFLPVAVNVFVLADHYGKYERRSSQSNRFKYYAL